MPSDHAHSPSPCPCPVPTSPTPVPGPGQRLFHFVRFWSRCWDEANPANAAPPDRERGRDVQVTEAVLACTRAQTDPTPGATINAIAAELGLDQSGASRMVAQAVRHGYLTKSSAATHTGDGRMRLVRVTDAGRALVVAARAWQEAIFADLTHDWTPDEVATFTDLTQRLQARATQMAQTTRAGAEAGTTR